jgi:hypothetical protein
VRICSPDPPWPHKSEENPKVVIEPVGEAAMFPRLAEQYRAVVRDLVMSLQALASCLQQRGLVASCYVCGDGLDGRGASFVADLGENHMVRFLVSDFGISWVESRDGHELVKLEGAEAIEEMQRVAIVLQSLPADRQRDGIGARPASPSLPEAA